MNKSEDKLVFTPTFFWQDMTYVLQLIADLFKKLIAALSGKGKDEEETPVEP